MEQRERDKKSRQFHVQETQEEQQPLFNAPIKVAQSDDRIQKQLGRFEMAMPLLEKYIGVQGPSTMRLSSAPQPYPHMGAGFNSSNREGYASSSSISGNSRSHMMPNNHNSGGSSSASAVPAFLKPKEAPPPPNGISRYGPTQQQLSSSSQHPGHNRPPLHDVSG